MTPEFVRLSLSLVEKVSHTDGSDSNVKALPAMALTQRDLNQTEAPINHMIAKPSAVDPLLAQPLEVAATTRYQGSTPSSSTDTKATRGQAPNFTIIEDHSLAVHLLSTTARQILQNYTSADFYALLTTLGNPKFFSYALKELFTLFPHAQLRTHLTNFVNRHSSSQTIQTLRVCHDSVIHKQTCLITHLELVSSTETGTPSSVLKALESYFTEAPSTATAPPLGISNIIEFTNTMAKLTLDVSSPRSNTSSLDAPGKHTSTDEETPHVPDSKASALHKRLLAPGHTCPRIHSQLSSLLDTRLTGIITTLSTDETVTATPAHTPETHLSLLTALVFEIVHHNPKWYKPYYTVNKTVLRNAAAPLTLDPPTQDMDTLIVPICNILDRLRSFLNAKGIPHSDDSDVSQMK